MFESVLLLGDTLCLIMFDITCCLGLGEKRGPADVLKFNVRIQDPVLKTFP